MQTMFKTWLGWPVVAIFASLFAVYLGTAALMVWLSFRSRLAPWIQSFRGVVPPFFGSTAIIFGVLIAFLSNDIWDRNKQAERVVFTESDNATAPPPFYSTVTLFARFLGLSTSVPRNTAV